MATEFTSERPGRGPERKPRLAATSEAGKLSDAGKCGPKSQESYLPRKLSCFPTVSVPGLEKVIGAISWQP